MNALTLIQATVEPTIKDKTGVVAQTPVDLKAALYSHLRTEEKYGSIEHIGTVHGQPVTGRLTMSLKAGWEFQYAGKSYAMYPREDGQFLFYEAYPGWAAYAKPVDKSKVRVFSSVEKSRYPVKLILKVFAECLNWLRAYVVATVEPGPSVVTKHVIDAIVEGYVDQLLDLASSDVNHEDADSLHAAGYRFKDVRSGVSDVKAGVHKWLALPGVRKAISEILNTKLDHRLTWTGEQIGMSLCVSVGGYSNGFSERHHNNGNKKPLDILEAAAGNRDLHKILPGTAARDGRGGLEVS